MLAKKEQAGCTLKSGTIYSGGKDSVFASVQVEDNEWFVISNARRKCGRSAVGGETYKGRPKVGKSYKFSSTRQQRIGTVRLTTTVTGSVKINSAKKATFTGSFAHGREGVTGTGNCGGPLSFTAARE